MFKVEDYDDLTQRPLSPWWMFFLLGLNFVLLGVLIFLFPQFLAWMVALFLLANGIIFFVIAWNVRNVKHRYRKLKKKHRIPVN